MREIESTLTKIIQQVWSEKDLELAKSIINIHICECGIKEEDKTKILNNIKDIKSKNKLDYYMANSLLTYEGKGLNKLK